MAEHGVIVPLLQRKVSLLGKTALLLDASTSVRTIKSEHLGAILSKKPSAASAINPKVRCIVFGSGAAAQTPQDVIDRALCATFAMNVFAGNGSVSCSKAFFFKFVKVYSITRIEDLPFGSDGQGSDFSFDPSAQATSISTLYAGCIAAVQKDPSLRISLRRFNSALSRSSIEEKIIDLAVCLESTFSSSGEITYRFSLFNSLLSGGSEQDRLDNFSVLKKFYGQRSTIVHGNAAPDAAWYAANWDTVIKIAKVSLVAKIDFLQNAAPADWQNHLDKLALG